MHIINKVSVKVIDLFIHLILYLFFYQSLEPRSQPKPALKMTCHIWFTIEKYKHILWDLITMHVSTHTKR